jgi:prolycopene isomerase
MSSAGQSFDVAVIGAGLGGLSAAATLAKSGKRVLVAERHDGPGGNARAFVRGPYTFDPAIHVTGYGYNVPIFRTYLQAVGAENDVEIVELGDLYGVDVDGTRFQHPGGEDAVIEYLGGHFPAEADGIAKFIKLCGEVTRQSQAPPPQVALKDLDAAVEAYPLLFKYRTSNFQEVVEEFVTDPQAQSLLGAHWPYMGVPPSKLGFLPATASWMALMEPGPVGVKGSFQQLADALAAVVTRHGGTVLFDSPVARIEIEGGRAAGVTLADGQRFKAPVVVSNADATMTFEQLVGEEHMSPGFMRRIRRMRPSASAFVLFSACTLPLHELNIPSEVFIYDHWDHDQTWADVEAGKFGGMWVSVPTLHDDSIAPEGEHLVTFTSLIPYDIGEPWAGAKGRMTEAAIDRIEQMFPGYRDSLTFSEGATPDTFHEYTLTRDGAIYGWANTPNQSQPKRTPQESPVEGLFLVGHWTNPGTGCLRCLFSGLRGAATISGFDDPISFLGSLF